MASDFPVFKTVREKYVYKRRENRYHQNLESGSSRAGKKGWILGENIVNWGISSNVHTQQGKCNL